MGGDRIDQICGGDPGHMMDRRMMLMAMNVLPDYFEEVDSFTPSQNVDSHTFSYDGTRAFYILLREPLLTENELINYQSLPGSGEFYALPFYITGAENSSAIKGHVLITIRPTYQNQGYIDYWGLTGSQSAVTTETTIFIDLAYSARNYFESGYTYTL